MKIKYMTDTYLREAEKYQIRLFLDEEDRYICIKKLISVTEKCIIKNNLCVMDNGYYVFEVVPKNENYAMRLFLDRDKKPLEYYFDITKDNRLDSITKVPCYNDLYLDITYLDGEIEILDEDELLEAYNDKDITKEDLDLVYRERDKLLYEIKNKCNDAMNIDFAKYLDDF